MSYISAIEQLAKQTGCEYKLSEPMSKHTTFKIGGPADIFLEPDCDIQISTALRYCHDNGVRCYIIGNGSNLLVQDAGIRGCVIHIGPKLSGITLSGEHEITCMSGTKLSALCQFALEQKLTGLEFAYGIPGSAGGAAFMNAGAYGGEMKDVITRCSHVSLDGRQNSFTAKEMQFGYRRSIYALNPNNYCITSVTVKLSPGNAETIKCKMNELYSKRAAKQPLEFPSAGSMFKRPQGAFAGALIEQCGLKGYQIGGAAVSTKHCGFVINRGGATCEDVKALVAHIQKTVLEQTGFILECEVKQI